MKFRPITVDNTLQELTQHSTDDFPMSMDEQQVGDVGCGLIRHWHFEIQIVLVTKGSVVFKTPMAEYLLHAGEGVFIGSGVLHEAVPTEEKNSVYICVNFKPELIYGKPDNMILRDYVNPILHSTELQCFALRDLPWQREICEILQELAKIDDAQEYGYEIMMKIQLCKIWHLILINNRDKTERIAVVTFSDKQRMKALKNFIHQNYMEHITLADIAGAGHISRGECCHVFKRAQQTTPIAYLKQYRIAQSIKLLTCTDLSILEVAYQAGFESGSYYTACFKSEMHCTPMEYRIAYASENQDKPGARANLNGLSGGEKREDQK